MAYGGFVPLVEGVRREQEYPVFAMNGGMYERDLSSVGLLVTDGVERKPAARGAGWGNFYLKPNGVFFIEGKRAGVMETEAYLAGGHKPDVATQSGPMLVIDEIQLPGKRRMATSDVLRGYRGPTEGPWT